MKHPIFFSPPLSSNNSIINPSPSPNKAIVQKHTKTQSAYTPYINKHPIKYTTEHSCIFRDADDLDNYHLSDGHQTRCPTNNNTKTNSLRTKRNATLTNPNQ